MSSIDESVSPFCELEEKKGGSTPCSKCCGGYSQPALYVLFKTAARTYFIRLFYIYRTNMHSTNSIRWTQT